MKTTATTDPSPTRLGGTLSLLFGLLAAVLGASGSAPPVLGARAAERAISPEAALSRLKEGNLRFRSGQSQHPHLDAARLRETAGSGQAPFATVLGCSDSRVPCELIFDQGVGDLFVVRVAGNVCDIDETGSIEYGIGHLGTPVLVVLGHEKCGAVTAVAAGAELEGSILSLVDNIRPAVDDARRLHPGLRPEALVPFALRGNVMQSIEDLLVRSETARKLARDGALLIVGAVYDLETGAVAWLGTHPRQSVLLREKGGDGGRQTARGPQHGAGGH